MGITWEVVDKSCRLGMALIMKCRYLLWVLEWAHNYTLIRVRIPLIYDAYFSSAMMAGSVALSV